MDNLSKSEHAGPRSSLEAVSKSGYFNPAHSFRRRHVDGLKLPEPTPSLGEKEQKRDPSWKTDIKQWAQNIDRHTNAHFLLREQYNNMSSERAETLFHRIWFIENRKGERSKVLWGKSKRGHNSNNLDSSEHGGECWQGGSWHGSSHGARGNMKRPPSGGSSSEGGPGGNNNPQQQQGPGGNNNPQLHSPKTRDEYARRLEAGLIKAGAVARTGTAAAAAAVSLVTGGNSNPPGGRGGGGGADANNDNDDGASSDGDDDGDGTNTMFMPTPTRLFPSARQKLLPVPTPPGSGTHHRGATDNNGSSSIPAGAVTRNLHGDNVMGIGTADIYGGASSSNQPTLDADTVQPFAHFLSLPSLPADRATTTVTSTAGAGINPNLPPGAMGTGRGPGLGFNPQLGYVGGNNNTDYNNAATTTAAGGRGVALSGAAASVRATHTETDMPVQRGKAWEKVFRDFLQSAAVLKTANPAAAPVPPRNGNSGGNKEIGCNTSGGSRLNTLPEEGIIGAGAVVRGGIATISLEGYCSEGPTSSANSRASGDGDNSSYDRGWNSNSKKVSGQSQLLSEFSANTLQYHQQQQYNQGGGNYCNPQYHQVTMPEAPGRKLSSGSSSTSGGGIHFMMSGLSGLSSNSSSDEVASYTSGNSYSGNSGSGSATDTLDKKVHSSRQLGPGLGLGLGQQQQGPGRNHNLQQQHNPEYMMRRTYTDAHNNVTGKADTTSAFLGEEPSQHNHARGGKRGHAHPNPNLNDAAADGIIGGGGVVGSTTAGAGAGASADITYSNSSTALATIMLHKQQLPPPMLMHAADSQEELLYDDNCDSDHDSISRGVMRPSLPVPPTPIRGVMTTPTTPLSSASSSIPRPPLPLPLPSSKVHVVCDSIDSMGLGGAAMVPCPLSTLHEFVAGQDSHRPVGVPLYAWLTPYIVSFLPRAVLSEILALPRLLDVCEEDLNDDNDDLLLGDGGMVIIDSIAASSVNMKNSSSSSSTSACADGHKKESRQQQQQPSDADKDKEREREREKEEGWVHFLHHSQPGGNYNKQHPQPGGNDDPHYQQHHRGLSPSLKRRLQDHWVCLGAVHIAADSTASSGSSPQQWRQRMLYLHNNFLFEAFMPSHLSHRCCDHKKNRRQGNSSGNNGGCDVCRDAVRMLGYMQLGNATIWEDTCPLPDFEPPSSSAAGLRRSGQPVPLSGLVGTALRIRAFNASNVTDPISNNNSNSANESTSVVSTTCVWLSVPSEALLSVLHRVLIKAGGLSLSTLFSAAKPGGATATSTSNYSRSNNHNRDMTPHIDPTLLGLGRFNEVRMARKKGGRRDFRMRPWGTSSHLRGSAQPPMRRKNRRSGRGGGSGSGGAGAGAGGSHYPPDGGTGGYNYPPGDTAVAGAGGTISTTSAAAVAGAGADDDVPSNDSAYSRSLSGDAAMEQERLIFGSPDRNGSDDHTDVASLFPPSSHYNKDNNNSSSSFSGGGSPAAYPSSDDFFHAPPEIGMEMGRDGGGGLDRSSDSSSSCCSESDEDSDSDSNGGAGGHNGECAIKIVNKATFWARVQAGKERPDSLIREVLAHALVSQGHHKGHSSSGSSSGSMMMASADPPSAGAYVEPKPPHLLENFPIVRLFSMLETCDGLVLEMELMQRQDLFDQLRRRGVFSESEATCVMLQLVEAVSQCHAHGIAHRDIKLSNIAFPLPSSEEAQELAQCAEDERQFQLRYREHDTAGYSMAGSGSPVGRASSAAGGSGGSHYPPAGAAAAHDDGGGGGGGGGGGMLPMSPLTSQQPMVPTYNGDGGGGGGGSSSSGYGGALRAPEPLPTFVKLLDFGMAGFCDGERRLRGRCGTPGYVAPEILSAGLGASYDLNVDMFSCGVVAYTLLCGYEPFYGADEQELMVANRNLEWEFHYPEWEGASKGARDWISRTLCPVERRMTPEEAVAHPWLRQARHLSEMRLLSRVRRAILAAEAAAAAAAQAALPPVYMPRSMSVPQQPPLVSNPNPNPNPGLIAKEYEISRSGEHFLARKPESTSGGARGWEMKRDTTTTAEAAAGNTTTQQQPPQQQSRRTPPPRAERPALKAARYRANRGLSPLYAAIGGLGRGGSSYSGNPLARSASKEMLARSSSFNSNDGCDNGNRSGGGDLDYGESHASAERSCAIA